MPGEASVATIEEPRNSFDTPPAIEKMYVILCVIVV